MSKERPVETYLCDEVARRGGFYLKLTWVAGIPDRLVVLPHGLISFVELKRPKGGVVSVIQSVIHARLRNLGARVDILCNRAEIDKFLNEADLLKRKRNG